MTARQPDNHVVRKLLNRVAVVAEPRAPAEVAIDGHEIFVKKLVAEVDDEFARLLADSAVKLSVGIMSNTTPKCLGCVKTQGRHKSR